MAYGGGAVLFAGTLAAHGDAPWPGVLGGLAVVALAQRVAAPVIWGARRRLTDKPARESLTLYLGRRLAARGRASSRRCTRSATSPIAALRLVSCSGAARAAARSTRACASSVVSAGAKPPKLVLCVIDAMAPEMLERTIAAGTAPVLERLVARRHLRARLRRRLPVGDAGLRGVDRHRLLAGRVTASRR